MIVCGIAISQRCVPADHGISIRPQVGDRKLHLWGKRITEVREELPMVILLAEGSTLEKPSVASDAHEKFNQAVRRLVRHGQAFCTVLRPEWEDEPVLLWMHGPNIE